MKNPHHKGRAHAPLAPSALKQFFECPGSFAISEQLADLPPSEAAQEGTIAHEWAEKLIHAGDNYDKILGKLTNYDEDMAYHVDGYVDFLDKIRDRFQVDGFDKYEEYLETRVRFTQYIWGTLDYGCVRRSKKKDKWQAVISDLKYGRGVYVGAEENPQIIAYLIGLEEHLKVRFEKSYLHIYQPRIQKDKPFERIVLTRTDIDVWRSKLMKLQKRCLAMDAGKLPLVFKAGDHCRFCKAKTQIWPTGESGCPTFRAYVQKDSLAILDKSPNMLPPITSVPINILVRLHKNKKSIEHYLQDVDHYLLTRGLRKQDIGDLKVVEGRSVRRWLDDEEKVADGIRKLGVQPFRKKLINIGDVERKIGKKKIDHLTTKPPGKLQLAMPEDKRLPAQIGKDSLDLL